MRVGFDVSPLGGTSSPGVERVVRCLIEALERRAALEVVRLRPDDGQELSRWRQSALPAAVTKMGLAGIHSFTSAFPWKGPGKRVQTLHEMPWRHGVRENAGWRHRAWVRIGALRADRVVCPTHFVARDRGRIRWARPGRIRVIPWGTGPPFQPDPPAGLVDEVLLERYRLGDEPFVVVVGGVRRKKNLAALLEGMAERARQGASPLRVVVTGPETPDLRQDLGLASRIGLARWVSTLGSIPEADLASLLRLSTAVCVLSHSEGFGLPVLEAMACGTPVLVSRNSAQEEIAGELGIRVDPGESLQVAQGLQEAVRERERLRSELPEQVRSFSWERCAGRIEDLWRELQ